MLSLLARRARSGSRSTPATPGTDNIAYLNYVRVKLACSTNSTYSADAHEVQRQVRRIRHLICLDQPDSGHPSLDDFLLPEGSDPISDWGEPNGDGEELTAIIATGGTTGPAKGVQVVLNHGSWGTMLETIGAIMPVDGPPVFLATAPLTRGRGPLHHGRHRHGRDRGGPGKQRLRR